jgi:hypothetical protein
MHSFVRQDIPTSVKQVVSYSLLSLCISWNLVKGKTVPQHLLRRREEKMYSSYSFMTSALDGCEWSESFPGRALPPGKGPPVSIVQEAGRASEPVSCNLGTGYNKICFSCSQILDAVSSKFRIFLQTVIFMPIMQ